MLEAMNPHPAAVAALSGAPRTGLSARFAAVTLALLLGLQALTTDLYLPALPMLAQDLAAPMPAVQMTMAALIFSFGVAQLVWGPVADRVGRRPVLIAGLVLYALAALGAACAGSIGQVIFWRGVQGAGMSAAVVCARAMVRDLYEPHEGAHVMSHALTGLGFIAVASPIAGGLLSSAAPDCSPSSCCASRRRSVRAIPPPRASHRSSRSWAARCRIGASRPGRRWCAARMAG
jgi:MFS transporter, DHA1 family, multidrug resistance protein